MRVNLNAKSATSAAAMRRTGTLPARTAEPSRRAYRFETYRRARETMKHPLSRELYDYWNQRRDGRAAPERGDIDPASIKRILGDSFVLSVEPGRDPVFRVAGTRICALFGRELRGEGFVGLWHDEYVAQIRGLVALISDEEIGVLAGARTEAEDEPHCHFELLVLPLSHRGRSGRRMLGSLVPMDRPYWLGIWPARSLTLGAVQFVGAEVYAAPHAGQAASRIKLRLRATLRVIDGGKS
jgi:hypothetical protein